MEGNACKLFTEGLSHFSHTGHTARTPRTTGTGKFFNQDCARQLFWQNYQLALSRFDCSLISNTVYLRNRNNDLFSTRSCHRFQSNFRHRSSAIYLIGFAERHVLLCACSSINSCRVIKVGNTCRTTVCNRELEFFCFTNTRCQHTKVNRLSSILRKFTLQKYLHSQQTKVFVFEITPVFNRGGCTEENRSFNAFTISGYDRKFRSTRVCRCYGKANTNVYTLARHRIRSIQFNIVDFT